MSSVSITTTQNVTIDHALADFRLRFLAYLIDLLIIGAWILIHTIIAISIFKNETSIQIYIFIIVIPFFSFYTLLMEYFMNGQTPGKRSMNIRVVMLNGKEPSFMDYFTRWSLRFVEIYLSSGVLASIMISTTNLKQRLADIIAGTVLVRVEGKYSVTAEDLLKIGSQSNYEPSYPEVIMFREADMLTIKKLVDRYITDGNEAHRLLIVETANKLSAKMRVRIKENKPELFLKAIIRDYVVLTR
ncbi:MAG: RDD family protein [Bacteroidia bacterium]